MSIENIYMYIIFGCTLCMLSNLHARKFNTHTKPYKKKTIQFNLTTQYWQR